MRRFLLVVTLLSSSICFGQSQTIHGDNSDWWSLLRSRSHEQPAKPGSGELDLGNFVVAGVSLHDSPQSGAIERLGATQKIARGDGSSARRQLCYEAEGKPPSFLIFESAEVSEGFYLFSASKNWKGRKHCTLARATNWKTNTGLRLGLSPAQVQTILGKADEVRDNRWLYLRQFKENKGDVTLYIEVRFASSKLNYLAASRADTN